MKNWTAKPLPLPPSLPRSRSLLPPPSREVNLPSKREKTRSFDEELVKKVYNRLENAEEPGFAHILGRMVVNKLMVRDRFLAVLTKLGKKKNRQKAFGIARIMLQIVAKRGWDVRSFVLLLLKRGHQVEQAQHEPHQRRYLPRRR